MADAGWCWVLLAGDGCCWVMLDAVFQHCLRAFLRAFLFCSSTFFVRIPTVFRHCLTRKRIQEEHIMRAFLLHFYYFPALASVRISTVFQHCRRAFLLCSSTFLHAFLLFSSTFLCAHSYCIPALPHAEKNPRGAHYACISIAFILHFYCRQHFSLCEFLLYSSTVGVHF